MTQNSINSSNQPLQVISNTILTAVSQTTVMPSDDSIPQNTEGDEVLTASITPLSATSTLEIIFSACSNVAVTGNSVVTVALFQDTTANALLAKSLFIGQTQSNAIYLQHFISTGSTSATTFKIRCGPSVAGTTRINAISGGTQLFNGVAQTILTIIEYGP